MAIFFLGKNESAFLQAAIAAGADPNKILKRDKISPLANAIANDNIDAVTQLIAAKADTNVSMPAEILFYSMPTINQAALEAILKKIYPDKPLDQMPSFSLLHAAILYNNPIIVKKLLTGGADPYNKDCGISPLELAQAIGNTQIIQILTLTNPKTAFAGQSSLFNQTRTSTQQTVAPQASTKSDKSEIEDDTSRFRKP